MPRPKTSTFFDLLPTEMLNLLIPYLINDSKSFAALKQLSGNFPDILVQEAAQSLGKEGLTLLLAHTTLHDKGVDLIDVDHLQKGMIKVYRDGSPYEKEAMTALIQAVTDEQHHLRAVNDPKTLRFKLNHNYHKIVASCVGLFCLYLVATGSALLIPGCEKDSCSKTYLAFLFSIAIVPPILCLIGCGAVLFALCMDGTCERERSQRRSATALEMGLFSKKSSADNNEYQAPSIQNEKEPLFR